MGRGAGQAGGGLRERLQQRGLGGGDGEVPLGPNPDDPAATRKFLEERIEKIRERLAELDMEEALGGGDPDAGAD